MSKCVISALGLRFFLAARKAMMDWRAETVAIFLKIP